MSYKIYNGFKFMTADMADALSLIEGWKPKLADLQRKWLARLHADMAVSLLDEAATSPGRHEGKVPLDAVRNSILDRQAKMDASSCRDPKIDPDFRISVFVHDTGIYGYVRTERDDWFEEFMQTDFVDEFAYWNGTDYRPEGVSREEWERRREVWREILDEGRSEAFECAERALAVTNGEIVAARPDFATRLNRSARRLAETREFARRELESRPDGAESDRDRFDRLIGISCDLMRWMNEEGRSAVDAAAATACQVLLPDIDEDDLMAVIENRPTTDPTPGEDTVAARI
ncbi:hypothetical protein OIU34_24180 [Pararhizobium sp. BT-229]|uniref:hypothetical protein n=1 Tax=Pararhizobium sp. BT-229 TaxID=2986923 RepID=UPI0021F7B161|nr:hypothetical protein [Pararhizobium sp. BT-229]MCV9964998.1 hypothetical protein [Pararhizobium sp. BT-229]